MTHRHPARPSLYFHQSTINSTNNTNILILHTNTFKTSLPPDSKDWSISIRHWTAVKVGLRSNQSLFLFCCHPDGHQLYGSGHENCGCLVTWFCYQLIAKPTNKTATVLWPDPYIITLKSAAHYSTHLEQRTKYQNIGTQKYAWNSVKPLYLYIGDKPYQYCCLIISKKMFKIIWKPIYSLALQYFRIPQINFSPLFYHRKDEVLFNLRFVYRG